jgi:hypothetical protein
VRRPFSNWLRSSALALALPGCLVSFNDYPLGDPKADEPTTLLKGGAAGSESVLPNAGSNSAAASSGGSLATGGTAAVSGGTTPADPSGGEGGVATTPTGSGLLDDFEDTDAQILELEGRSGAWYVANDGSGQQTPRAGVPPVPSTLMPARGQSTRGAHTFGGPFNSWGALIGTTLASEGAAGAAYDLSGYQGIRLWVRSAALGPNAARKVRFNLRTPATVMGGGCSVCGDHFGADIPLTAQWVQVEVPFSSLKQVGFGMPKPAKADLTQALGIELLFAVNVSFDLWLDDIELY